MKIFKREYAVMYRPKRWHAFDCGGDHMATLVDKNSLNRLFSVGTRAGSYERSSTIGGRAEGVCKTFALLCHEE